MSKHAQIAKDGNKAEQVLCQQANIKASFEQYFGKPIQSIVPITSRKKSDYKVIFSDGSFINIQNKDGSGNGRGWSINRMPYQKYGTDTALHTLLANVCLKRGTDRPTVSGDRSPEIIRLCLLGREPEYEPHFFTHTQSDKTTGEITLLSITPTNVFLETILAQKFETMVPKRTCVHLSPIMYLQRKGGGVKDKAPDHIQAKFRWSSDLDAVFTKLTLALVDQTTAQPVAPVAATV